MYEVNGIVYAGTPDNHQEVLTVSKIRALADYKLRVRFSTGEEKNYNFKPLLKYPVFRPLKNKALFERVRIKYGAPVLNNGEIDIDPECLYENGQAVSGVH